MLPGSFVCYESALLLQSYNPRHSSTSSSSYLKQGFPKLLRLTLTQGSASLVAMVRGLFYQLTRPEHFFESKLKIFC